MSNEVSKGKQPYRIRIDKNRPPKYYSPEEVKVHNTAQDLWVSWLGNVYDLTSLAKQHKGEWTGTYYVDKISHKCE